MYKRQADFSAPAKLLLAFDMLAGRLELYPMLALFAPRLWRKRINAMHEAKMCIRDRLYPGQCQQKAGRAGHPVQDGHGG